MKRQLPKKDFLISLRLLRFPAFLLRWKKDSRHWQNDCKAILCSAKNRKRNWAQEHGASQMRWRKVRDKNVCNRNKKERKLFAIFIEENEFRKKNFHCKMTSNFSLCFLRTAWPILNTKFHFIRRVFSYSMSIYSWRQEVYSSFTYFASSESFSSSFSMVSFYVCRTLYSYVVSAFVFDFDFDWDFRLHSSLGLERHSTDQLEKMESCQW